MDPSQTKALSPPCLPQQVPLFVLFQPNFAHRDSGCSLPPPGFIWALSSGPSRHWLHISLLHPFHSWEDEAQRNLHLLACSGTQLLGALSVSPASEDRESRSWLGTWCSQEETSSKPSPVGSFQAPIWPPSLPPSSSELGSWGQAPWESSAPEGSCRQPPRDLQDPVLWRSSKPGRLGLGDSG